MTKKDILKKYKMTEKEFYKKFPTQESFQKFEMGGSLPSKQKFQDGGLTPLVATYPTQNLPATGTNVPTAAAAPAAAPGNGFKLSNLSGLGGGQQAPQQAGADPNAPTQKNIGKTIGAVGGAAIGSLIPGAGTMIGGVVGGAIGGAIDKKTYENKMEDYSAIKSSQQNAMTSNIAGNFNPNAQGKQFKMGGNLIKRADGSYSKRGLWDNIRANKGSGKAPTKEMLAQEKKIKANYKEGGIHIKPENKGKFTATKKATGKTTEELTHSKNPLTRKRAIFAQNAAKWHHAHGGVDTSNSMSGPKYAKGGELKPMGNDMYEVKSYKKGTDKVEYRPNVFIDNKEIIRKNPDGSTQILSDDLGYAKVAKSLAKAKGGNISDNQFDQLYMAQEMSKTNRSKSKGMFFNGGFEIGDNVTGEPVTYGNQVYGSSFSPFAETPQAPNVTTYNTEEGEQTRSYDRQLRPPLVSGTPMYPKYNPKVTEDVDARSVTNPKNIKSIDLKTSPYQTPSSTTPPPPDGTKPLQTSVNPLGYLSSLVGPAYTIAQGLKGPDPVNFDRMNTKYQYADPRGAMAAASRGVTSAYNAAKNATRNTATSAGEYLANMGSLASKEGIDRAATIAGIKGQYDMSNTQGLNQSNLMKDQFNAQVQMNESIARQQEKDAARSAVSSGLSNIGQNTMGYTAERDRAKNDRLMAGLLNESYEVVYNKDTDSYELQPKPGKKKKSNVITSFD